jgi:hypothetical protein
MLELKDMQQFGVVMQPAVGVISENASQCCFRTLSVASHSSGRISLAFTKIQFAVMRTES